MSRDRKTRDRAIALLELLSIGGMTDVDVEYLMRDVLRLPLSYFAAVHQVVREERWRTAKDPVEYVRTAAWRGTDVRTKPDGLPVPAGMSHDEFVDLQTAYAGLAKKSEGIWRATADDDDYDPNDYDEDGTYLTPGERLRSRIPERFCRYWPTPEERAELERLQLSLPVDPIPIPDWNAIAKAAGLDRGEAEVLQLRAMGLNRTAALALYGTDEKRRQIQAAWRRFDRNRGLERVAKVLINKEKYLS